MLACVSTILSEEALNVCRNIDSWILWKRESSNHLPSFIISIREVARLSENQIIGSRNSCQTTGQLGGSATWVSFCRSSGSSDLQRVKLSSHHMNLHSLHKMYASPCCSRARRNVQVHVYTHASGHFTNLNAVGEARSGGRLFPMGNTPTMTRISPKRTRAWVQPVPHTCPACACLSLGSWSRLNLECQGLCLLLGPVLWF